MKIRVYGTSPKEVLGKRCDCCLTELSKEEVCVSIELNTKTVDLCENCGEDLNNTFSHVWKSVTWNKK